MITVFGPDESKSYYASLVNKLKFKDNLKIHIVDDGCVVVDNNNENFGVLDKNGALVSESVSSHRSHARHLCDGHKKYRCEYYDYDVVYCGGGLAIQHFGHLLVEGINRIYPFFKDEYKNCKFVFTLIGKKEVPTYVLNMLRLAGIPNENIIFLKKPARFKRVYVPDEAFDWTEYSSPEMAKIGSNIANNAKETGQVYKKIYLSRLKTGDRRTIGESVIQKIFENNGYKVIYPEQLSVEEQVGLVKNCKYLAGTAGTALHLALFMKPGGTLIQIKRNSEPDDNFFVQNLINQTVGLDTILVWGSIEKTPSRHFTKYPQIIGPTEYFIEFLEAAKFKFSKEDLIVPKSILDEYDLAVSQYKKMMGGKFSRSVKKFICRIFSCVFPGQHNRKVVREFLERLLHFEQDY